jgi:hypothetical protein
MDLSKAHDVIVLKLKAYMAYLTQLQNLYTTTCQIENKGLNLVKHAVI